MTYATQALLTARYGNQLLVQLTDRAAVPTGAVDASVIARALADTDAMIDGYLAGRYVLPLSDTPPILADLAQAIAIYKLHPYAADAKIEADYRDAIATLRDISKGTVRLPLAGLAAGTEPASSGTAGVVTIDRDRDLTPENLKGFC